MNIYLSGPMSGIEDHNFPLFFEAHKVLTDDYNYNVVNPAELGQQEGWSWSQYLRRDIKFMVEQCDKICLLDGWWSSKGALVELVIALCLDFEIYSYNKGYISKGNLTLKDVLLPLRSAYVKT